MPDDVRRSPTRRELESELAAPVGFTFRNPWVDLETVPDAAGLIAIWGSARRGDPDDLLVLGRQILQRDLHIRSVYQTRKMAVERVPTHVIPTGDSAAEQRIADAVREFVVETPAFRQLRKDLLGAVYQGYEVVEVVWDTSSPSMWVPTYQWRWPNFFVWDRATGTEMRLRTKSDPLDGEEIPDRKFICHYSTLTTGHVFGRGLLWPLSSMNLFKSADVRAWISLGEKYGIPWRVAESETKVSEQDRENFVDAMHDLGEDASLLLPPGVKLQVIDALKGGGASDFHERFARWANQEISKGYLGQTMTSENGSSLAQAKIHKEIADIIRDADLVDLDERLRETVVRWFVEFNFGPSAPVPHLLSTDKTPEDIAAVGKALLDASKAAGRAIPVGWLAVLERLGFPAPEEGEVLLDGGRMGPDGPEYEDATPASGDGDGDGD